MLRNIRRIVVGDRVRFVLNEVLSLNAQEFLLDTV